MPLTFDAFLRRRIGAFGRWHVLLMVTLLPTANTPLEFFAQVAFVPPAHHCRQPVLANLSWPSAAVLNLSIPGKDPRDAPAIGQAFAPCEEFVLDAVWPHLGPNTSLEEALALRARLAPNLSRRACAHGYTFVPGTERVQGSFAEEFGIVCSRQHFVPLSNSAYIVGMAVGSLGAGPLADRVGRRAVCLGAPLLVAASGLASCAVRQLWAFTALRVVSAMAAATTFILQVVLVGEWVTAEQRNAFSFIRKTYFGLVARGALVLCFFLLPNWRWAYGAYMVVTLPTLAGAWVWLESPRWLLAQGRADEALALLLRVRKMNGRPAPAAEAAEMRAELAELGNAMRKSGGAAWRRGLTAVVGAGRFRRRFWLLSLIWPMQNLVFYGLNFNAVRLDGPALGIAFLTSLLVLPATALQFLLYRFFDRKWPMMALYALCSLLLAAAFLCIVAGIRGTPTIVVATAGLLFADSIFTMIYAWTPELFPTDMRSTVLGVCAAVSRVGMVLGAYAERLDELVWTPLPMLVFAAGAVVASVASALLPSSAGEMEEWSVNGELADDGGKGEVLLTAAEKDGSGMAGGEDGKCTTHI